MTINLVGEYINSSPLRKSLLWALEATDEEFSEYLSKRVYEKKPFKDEKAEEKLAEYRQRLTGLNRKEQKKYVFENLEVTKENKDAIERAKSWDVAASHMGLILSGPTGVGKTAIAKCVVNKWGASGYRCKLITSVDFLDYLKLAMNEKSTSVSRELEIFSKYDILILDDLGSELTTEWGLSQIFALINARYENERATFITTNLGGSQLREKYSPRIYDRISNMAEVFVIKMESFRGKA